ncbi:MAG: NUDIX domain-containing protein [Firmicutes bacterium]|nr:NUDIX domain-containing protein [Bacillota bacterium]
MYWRNQMDLLKEILHKEKINKLGKTISRDAVRGIILKDKQLLMIYSKKNGDYKFPGGGVDGNESHLDTLKREVLEESGATVSKVVKEFGKVIEYDQPLEDEYDVFKMTSFYYICKVNSEFTNQNLDLYEKELGFEPIWVDIDKALNRNISIINNSDSPRWVIRENFILKEIKQLL